MKGECDLEGIHWVARGTGTPKDRETRLRGEKFGNVKGVTLIVV